MNKKAKKKPPRAIYVLKENIQAFGLLVEKAITKKEVFQYPIITIANPDCSLR